MTASGELTVDKPVMYCSYFSYGPNGSNLRQRFATQSNSNFIMKVTLLEQQAQVPPDSTTLLNKFLESNDQEQRDIIDLQKVSIRKLGPNLT